MSTLVCVCVGVCVCVCVCVHHDWLINDECPGNEEFSSEEKQTHDISSFYISHQITSAERSTIPLFSTL